MDIESAFASFAGKARAVVACWDDPGVRRALEGSSRPLLRYGTSPHLDVVIDDVRPEPSGSRSSSLAHSC